jgi:hypothetical protein
MSKKLLWRFLREPLLHFVLLGSLLFISFAQINDYREVADNVIVVSAGRVSQLKFQFESTWKRTPTPGELDNLIEGHIREEVYYRSALSLALDRNDAVVRRRMQQKMEFLINTGSYLIEPIPGELEAYFTANELIYRQSARFAIEQIYLGEKPDPEEATRSLAVLNSDQNTDPDPIGEQTFLPGQLGLSTPEVIDSVFGQGFFKQLVELPQQRWVGPLVSAFGVHLVRIYDHSPGRTPALSDIRDLVQQNWREAKAKDVLENDYVQRRSRFVIEIEREDESQSMQGQ